MLIKNLALSNYRNIKSANIEFSENVNVFKGDNAQGKTNILEAIWLFSGNRSFRGNRDADLIQFGEKKATAQIHFVKNSREQNIKIEIEEIKRAVLNGVYLKTAGELVGTINMTVFLPSHLSLVKEGPGERRRFLDSCISAIKPNYRVLMQNYQRCVAERNSILKDISFHSELFDMLVIFEERMANYGAKILGIREKYVEKLSEHAKKIYYGISNEKEELELKYFSTVEKTEECYQSFVRALEKSRKEDMQTGVTSVGIHRDDLNICILGKSAREYGSQGQQRSAVLSLKIAESEIQSEVLGERPVILLDDVMSELDSLRQEYLFSKIKGSQVFITGCETPPEKFINQGKIFTVVSGEII